MSFDTASLALRAANYEQCPSEHSAALDSTAAVAPALLFDLLGTSSFGGGGGGGGGNSNNGNEGNEGNEGTEGNEGNENDENNEGDEGNEGNFLNDLVSGLSNIGGNIVGGLHQIGGAIGDIGGGEDSGNEGNEGDATSNTSGTPASSSGIASGSIPSAGQSVTIRTTTGVTINVSVAGGVPQAIIDAAVDTAIDYANAVRSGAITAQNNLSRIDLTISDLPADRNGQWQHNPSTGAASIGIDYTPGAGARSPAETAATTVHELTHGFNRTLHETGLLNQNTHHSSHFYAQVDSAANALGIDPGRSGTEHPNASGAPPHNSSNLPSNQSTQETANANDGDEGNENNEGNEVNGSVGWNNGDEGNENNEGNEANGTAGWNNGDEGNEGNEGDEGNEGNEGDEGDEGNEGNEGNARATGGGGKPVVIDLDGDGVEIDKLGTSTAKFDYDNDGFREKTAWVGKDDGLLMFDIGNDGKVTDAKEIAFAYMTENEDDTDLEALRELFDSNGDDVLNAEDDDWSQFRIWKDSNQNGMVDEGELMTLDEVGITEIGLITREGTSEVLSDGTVNHGLIDVTMADGTTVDGGDIAFAFDQNGERETVDENGNTVTEYENGAPSTNSGAVSFAFGDQSQLIHHLHMMGFMDNGLAVLEMAVQEGDNVVFKQNGVTVVAVENTTLAALAEAMAAHVAASTASEASDADDPVALVSDSEGSEDIDPVTSPATDLPSREIVVGETTAQGTDDLALEASSSDETATPADSDPLIAYDGDMFEFDEEAEDEAPSGDITAPLTAQAVAASAQDAPQTFGEEPAVDVLGTVVEAIPLEQDQAAGAVNEEAA